MSFGRAESQAPQNPALLAALGRLNHASGHLDRALDYFQRALALDSTSTTVRAELEAVQREHAHRTRPRLPVRALQPGRHARSPGGLRQRQLPRQRRAPRLRDRAVRAQVLGERGARGRRDRVAPHAGTAGSCRRAHRRRRVDPAEDRRLRRGSTTGRGRATWSFDLRFAEFDSVDVQVGGAGLRLALTSQADAWARYCTDSRPTTRRASPTSFSRGYWAHPATPRRRGQSGPRSSARSRINSRC